MTVKQMNRYTIKSIENIDYDTDSNRFVIRVQEIQKNDAIQLQKATEKSKKKGEDAQKSVPNLLERMGNNKTGF